MDQSQLGGQKSTPIEKPKMHTLKTKTHKKQRKEKKGRGVKVPPPSDATT